MIPRQALVERAGPRGVELEVPVPLAQRAAPVPPEPRGALQKVADAAVAARQQRLQRRLARVLVQHADRGQPADALLDRRQLARERLGAGERRPLERRPRLGHEGRDRECEPPERPAPGVEHAQPLEHAAREGRDRLDVLVGLGRLADHEVRLEVRDAVGAHDVAGAQDLLVGDRLADGPPQPLGAGLRRDRQRAMAAPRQGGRQIVGEAVGP